MVKKTTTKARPVEGQKKRIPLHESRDKMTVKGINMPNYVLRHVNDGMPNDPYRIQRFLDAGWMFVRKNSTSGECELGDRTVNSAESDSSLVTLKAGNGITTYLMAIHKDFYDEDFAAKQRKVDATEESMKAAGKQEGRYGSVTIE